MTVKQPHNDAFTEVQYIFVYLNTCGPCMHCLNLSSNYWVNSQLNFLRFQIVFTGVANTSSTPIGWEGGRRAGSHKVAGKGYVFTKTSQMVSIGAIFTSAYHTKQLNPWLNSSASRVVNYSRLSASQGDVEPFEGDLSTCGRLTSLSKSSPGNFQHQYLPELLVNVYCTSVI